MKFIKKISSTRPKERKQTNETTEVKTDDNK